MVLTNLGRNPSDSAGSHVRKLAARHILDDDDDYVPIHWMGSNRVQMTMVRRNSLQRMKGPQQSNRAQQRKQVADAKSAKQANWRRLLRQSEKLVDDGSDRMGPITPDPMSDVGSRSRLLSGLQPPRLHRLDARISEHERAEASPARIPDVREESSSSSCDSDDSEQVRAREARQESRKRRSKVATRDGQQLERHQSAAAALITTLYKGGEGGGDRRAMCPFSGQMAHLDTLQDHMEEWRSLMRAELTSLQHDATHGPRVGLFVVPTVPHDVPSAEATPEELKQWSDLSLTLYKSGYVMVKPENRKYHWTELRKVLETPAVPCRPWERGEDELDEERTIVEQTEAIEQSEREQKEREIEEYQTRSASVSPLRRKQMKLFADGE